MKSSRPEKNTIEITNISIHGIWLLVDGVEYYLSYENFPWFRDQPIKAIHNVEQISDGHFYWPDIDVDISKKIIESPDQYPLKYK